jgi:predicted ATPase/class 3 adenylate cyclase/Tfp pilus assembly protein PilF
MADLPSGTVTFLFTDIAGSTRLWQAYPAAMARAYDRHDAILREVVAAHRGVVYKVIGDAFQAAFPSAPGAVAATLAAQQRLVAEEWGACGLPEPLRVRMALHVGDVEPSPDGDYRSPVLNRLGRLLRVGHGGQVLLSQGVFELARDTLPESATLRDLGERRLKDLYRPERVHQLLHPALPSAFPPLATLDRRPHNLPIQPTPLIGREAEVAAVRSLLTRREARLVTLTGPGGIGKTRLGLQVAADVVDVFNHGAFFVPLAAISDPGLVPSAIAQALGVAEEPGRPLTESVQEHLREREMLLVLDNFEQVLAAAPVVATLLAAAPGLLVVATSRERLGLRGEREMSVPPLSVPVAAPARTVEQVTQYEAVRLFIARAGEARPGFQVTNETAPAVAQICVRLDGLPLAIELAAARAKVLPPKALLERLERRLATLTGGARDLPERQRTLRAAIAWSYDLLTPEEQALFRRLGVFVGGFTLDAAEAVGRREAEGGRTTKRTTSAFRLPPSASVLDLIASLTDKSLLRQSDEAVDGPRFGMLETIREFALEQLAASGEADVTRRAHAEHFRAVAGEVSPLTWGPEQALHLDRLEAELDNLRATFAWAVAAGETLTALNLGICLEKLWDVRGYLSEGRDWLERASALPMDGVPGGPRAQALSNAGALALAQGDLDGARDLQERALAIIREVATEGGQRGTAHTLNRLGIIAYLQGDTDRAVALQEDALARFRALGDGSAAATTLNNLGVNAEAAGDLARARTLYEEALVLQREAGDIQSIAIYLSNLGGIARQQGDHPAAVAAYRESLLAWRGLQDRWNSATTLLEVARLASMRHGHERAARLFGSAEALAEAVGVPLVVREEERADYARDVAAVRAALGEAAFAAAWAAGRALHLDAAIAEALAALE